MNSPIDLSLFTGGTMYCRIVSFEAGPDHYYLLRYGIGQIELLPDGGIAFTVSEEPAKRYLDGRWIDHGMPGPMHYPQSRGRSGTIYPVIRAISEHVAMIEIDELLCIVIYMTQGHEPVATEAFRDFQGKR